jgi:hypothetical protein
MVIIFGYEKVKRKGKKTTKKYKKNNVAKGMNNLKAQDRNR